MVSDNCFPLVSPDLFSFLAFVFAEFLALPLSVSFLFDLKQNIFWFGLVIMFCIPWSEFNFVNQRLSSLSTHPVLLSGKIILHIGVLLICTSFLVGSTYNPFLYFRF